MTARAPALGLALLVAAAGCAPTLRQLRQAHLPPSVRVTGVPVRVQREDHCGPTALASLLAWAGADATPDELAPRVYLPGRSGTLAADLLREIRLRGFLAYRVPPDPVALAAEVAAGHPVLVLENRGLRAAPAWHYSVLVGYELDEGAVVLHAGGAEPETVDVDAFRRSWLRGGGFGVLALPPGALPGADDPDGVLSALADLEETGRPAAAAAGYGAFVARWPGRWEGWFGRGNALRAAGGVEDAEEAFRRAHAAAPDRPEPLNNLALLAAAAGRDHEARALARAGLERARALGLDPRAYEDTLARVDGRP